MENKNQAGKRPQTAEDFLWQALGNNEWITHVAEKRILAAMESYAASRQQGYSSADYQRCWDCLNELVEVKKIKETEGSSVAYVTRQPKAWEAAKQFIATHPTPEGKALLSEGSMPVGAQDIADSLLFENSRYILEVSACDEDSEIPITLGRKSRRQMTYMLSLNEATELANALLYYVKLEKEANP